MAVATLQRLADRRHGAPDGEDDVRRQRCDGRSGCGCRVEVSSEEVLEAAGRQLGISHRVLDVLVTEIGLQRPRIVALAGQRETAGMSQHVRMALKPRSLASTPARSIMRAKPAVANGDARSLL